MFLKGLAGDSDCHSGGGKSLSRKSSSDSMEVVSEGDHLNIIAEGEEGRCRSSMQEDKIEIRLKLNNTRSIEVIDQREEAAVRAAMEDEALEEAAMEEAALEEDAMEEAATEEAATNEAATEESAIEKAAMTFFLVEGGYEKRKGETVWRKMVARCVCPGRTCQSLKKHFMVLTPAEDRAIATYISTERNLLQVAGKTRWKRGTDCRLGRCVVEE